MRDLTSGDIAAALVDARCGLITSIDHVPPLPGGPMIQTYRGALAAPYAQTEDGLQREKMDKVVVSGCSRDDAAARWALIGEGLERYAAYRFPAERSVCASFNNLGDSALDPRDWISFADAPYGKASQYVRFDPDAAIRWTEARRYGGGPPRLIASVLAWLRLGGTERAEEFIQRASTGLGAGTSLAQAQRSGLLEVIERDAFSSRWLLGASPSRIAAQSDINQFYGDATAASGILVDLFDIAVDDLAHVVLARLCVEGTEFTGGAFGFALGASAHPDKATAARKAIEEGYHILQGMLHWRRQGNATVAAEDLSDFLDHGHYYSQPGPAADAAWFFADRSEDVGVDITAPSTAAPDYEQDVARLIYGLAAQGRPAYFVDITPPDVRSLGFHVVKSLVPMSQPLTCGARVIADDRRRIAQVATHLGLPRDTPINRQVQPFA
ncbi:YcaO-like family protein [Tateyamaria sp. SN3-11]|uniref:YcaO-like family protein n=1 Tax=Tateyamaria sp. SN3-11 TaxID=3092147 RepID=UPI0039E9C920